MKNLEKLESIFALENTESRELLQKLPQKAKIELLEINSIFEFLDSKKEYLNDIELISLKNGSDEFLQIFKNFKNRSKEDDSMPKSLLENLKYDKNIRDGFIDDFLVYLRDFYRGLHYSQPAVNNIPYYIPIMDIYKRVKLELLNREISGVSEVYKYSESLKKIFEESKKVQEEINRVAADVVVKDYAEIFLNQAKTHSNLGKFSWANTDTDKFGLTQKWFFGTIALIILFFLFATNIGKIIPLTGQNITQLTFSYITRVLSFSLFIYIITVSIKQFNIHQHLATINRNRANTLNTFTLFMNTIGKDDPAVRNAFILEVAKSIFDTMNTGFIAQKEGDASNSVTELIRYMTPTTNK